MGNGYNTVGELYHEGKAVKRKQYTVTDGNLVLTIESDGGKWLVVTSPFDPELVTQARTIDEAFSMAYDAKKLLDECRADRARELKAAQASTRSPRKRSSSGSRRKSIEV